MNNDDCIWLEKYEDVIIWIKNPSQIYFSVLTKKDSMVAYIWLTRFLNFVLFEYYGLLNIHCSCLTNNGSCDEASIFCGESGAGKSSIALELVSHGNKLIAEDNLYIKIVDGNAVALGNISTIKIRKASSIEYNGKTYISKYDDFFEKNVIMLNDHCFLENEYSIPRKLYILNHEKSITGSIKHLAMKEGVMYFLREYSTYSVFNSEKLIDYIFKLCSQCQLYMLTPSYDVKKTVQFIT